MERDQVKWHVNGIAILAGILALAAALYAQNNSGPPGAAREEAANLQRAGEYFKQNKLTEAENLCESLVGSITVGAKAQALCDKVKNWRECEADAGSALRFMNRGACPEALEILRSIHQRCPEYPLDLLDSRAQLLCPTPQRPPGLDEGIALFKKHKYTEAEAVFAGLQPKYPSLVEIQNYLRTTRVELCVQSFKAALKRHDLGQAKELITKLEESAPDDTRIPKLRAELQGAPAVQETRREKDQNSSQDALFEEALQEYYNGDFPRADQLLEQYLGQPGKYAALAYFYRGAIVCTDYFLTGAKDEQKQTHARDFFSKARQADGKFTPPRGSISPKILGVYDKTASGS
jgi:hypothetical protein